MKSKKYHSPKIKLSTTFPTRSICKFCQKSATIYYFYKNEKIYKSPEVALKYERVYTINVDLYEHGITKYHEFQLADSGNFPLTINRFNIKMHRCINISNSDNYEESLYCECGKTCWIINYKSSKNRKEISMKKTLKTFDKEYNL